MERPKRKNIRLKGWDYSSHACYHVTICTHEKSKYLSAVDEEKGDVKLTDIGICVERALTEAEGRYPCASVTKYVIMPNHVHVLLTIDEGELILGRFVGHAKSKATSLARQRYPGLVLWQRGYYEHIIRNDREFHDTWEYIENNPAKWASDEYH